MKLEYDQCFYKYIEQKTKELFMSVNSVNGISQMQNAQGVSFGSSNQDEGSGLDIGKLLVGGVVVAAVAGVGIAGYKSGKTLKEGDGVLTTVWNGIKSWFGKNGDDVAQVAKNDIPAECKTSLKTLFSGGEISQTQKQDIVENADEISKVFSNKAGKNATKYDELTQIVQKGNDDEKKQALAKFLKVNGELTLDGNTLKAASTEDQAIIARKLKNTDGNSITGNSIDDIIKGLQDKYETKNKNYNLASNKLKNLTDVDTIIPKTATPATPVASASSAADDVNNIIAKRFNRAGAAQTLAENCKDSLSYINTQKSLTKWLNAGDLTQDEYDNLMAMAENNFMSKNKGTDYLNYMTQGLMKANGSEIDFNSLDEESINLLNNKFKGLNITKASSGKTTEQQLIDWKRNNTKSISEYLGLNGCSLSASDASGFKLVDGKLVWEASAEGGIAPDKIFNIDIGENCTKTKESGTVTRKTLNLDNIKKIFKSATA